MVPPTISISSPSNPDIPVSLSFEFNGQERMLPLVEGHWYTLECSGSSQLLRGSNILSTSGPYNLTSFSNSRDGGTYHCVAGSLNVSVRISAGKGT